MPGRAAAKGPELALAVVVALAGAAVARAQDGADAAPLRINDLQLLGSHNSYKQRIEAALYQRLAESRPQARLQTLQYGHLPLAAQLDLGLRGLELDVYDDPEGGRYAAPLGLRWLAEDGVAPSPPYDPEGVMSAPGLKVLHVQDIDFRSSCLTLRRCLEQLRGWSEAHPAHVPIVVTMNAKADPLAGVEGAVSPLPFDAAAYDRLDREILGVMGRSRLIVPDQVRGELATLRQAVLLDRWPTLAAARGRFLFVLDESGPRLEPYLAGHPSLRGRVLFANAPPESDEAAVLILNEPATDSARIRSFVEQGFLVRTRADADTLEARRGDDRRRDQAFGSGAQLVSTDYYVEDPELGTGYRVELPGGGVARCNPVRRRDPCRLDH